MSAALEKLFVRIRQSATPQAWSAGVTLAREKKIVRDGGDGDSIVFRVIAGARGKSVEVELFPDDLEWQCDCGSPAEACEHVAGAIIASHSAEKTGAEVPTHRAELFRLVYRLFADDGLLSIERMRIGSTGPEVAWATPLGGESRDGTTILQAPGDLEVDLALGSWRRGRVPKTEMVKLLAALAKCAGRVTFAAREVTVSTRPVVPELHIEDAGRGFFAKLAQDPTVEQRFRNGAALVSDVLRPIDDQAGISEGERAPLARGKPFNAEDAAELAHLIQRLEKKIPVRVFTTRLPRGEAEPPRLTLDTSNEEDRLVVLPTLVYGDPPIARVDRGAFTILDASRPVPLRDEREENRLAQRLFASLGLEIGRKSVFEGQDAVSFASKLENFQRGAHKDLAQVRGNAWEDFTLQGGPLQGKIALDADGHFDLSFTTADGDAADPVRVMRAWARGWSVAPLAGGGGFAPLPVKWLAQYGATIANLLDAKGEKDLLPASAVADVAHLSESLGVPMPPRFEALRKTIGNFDKLPAAKLPDDLTADLRPYQQDGVAWLGFHREAGLGALLADDMGLGKTLQALCAIRGRTLVVAPTSVLYNWAREAARFRPSLKVATFHGPGRKLDAAADLTLTTWSILRLDADLLLAQGWDTVVLDEAQTIKNPESQVARAAHRLRAPFRICLSGTPIENRLDDLWSQMAFLEPGFLGAREAFQQRYVQPIQQGNALAAQELRQRIRPFLLRRLKREVAPDLPPRTELVERCELNVEERQVYDALRAAAKKEVMEELGRGGNVIAALELLLRLRQAACHRGLVPGQDGDGGPDDPKIGSSSKVELLMELVDELAAEGHKVLVFSQWTSLLDRVEPHLKAARIDFLRLDGSTADRQAVVDGFQAADGPPVLLLSLKAGGTGLTLTAADHVVLMDPWWNPAVEDQAADRAHRIGQDKPVFVHRLVAADTVEERILQLQEDKRKVAEAALGQGAIAAQALTRDDLLALLG
ncbi:MAG: DEAD/DEAH box helicase [Deltaproteobacteria bacterium]|nr:DEAD/DEAH box helicase [Deltaproteobacteria bacterium]